MAGDHRLRPLARIFNLRPITQKPFRCLANRILNVPEPRTHLKAKVKLAQCLNPFLGRLLIDADLGAKTLVDQLLPAPMHQDLRQSRHLVKLGDFCQVTDVFLSQLIESQLIPPARESTVTSNKGFRESAICLKRIPLSIIQRFRRPNQLLPRKRSRQQFGHGERVHTIGEIPTHHTVALLFVDIHLRRPRCNHPGFPFIQVEETL